ncbi:YolD-like family protein [Paenibacillus enshidis]|uniref:YolD-like family protein n=1 Tax=Paenibacillus enshidis TaxID=1458439 RepID=A0ABV5AVG8_9BACL
MSKKMQGNGLFESSRFILPEFKEAYLANMKEQERRGKPVLDDQEVQLIEKALIESYNRRTPVTVTVFNPFDDEVLTGIVTALNTNLREVKLIRGEDDFSWIKLEVIISAAT